MCSLYLHHRKEKHLRRIGALTVRGYPRPAGMVNMEDRYFSLPRDGRNGGRHSYTSLPIAAQWGQPFALTGKRASTDRVSLASFLPRLPRCSLRSSRQRAYCWALAGSRSSSPLSQKQYQSTVVCCEVILASNSAIGLANRCISDGYQSVTKRSWTLLSKTQYAQPGGRAAPGQREYGNTAILEIIEAHEGKKVSGPPV